MSLTKTWIVGCVALALGGCALTSKSEAMDVRYFTPERVAPVPGHATAPAGTELRLGRVTSGPHLRERIAYREAGHEIGYYEDRRWTERPDAYVRRALERRLFEESGFRRVLGGPAPALEVEVLAFDELRSPNGTVAAHVSLRMVVVQDRVVLREDTLAVDVPVARATSQGVDDVVAALSSALDLAAAQVSARVFEAVKR